nr:hypothetical protein [Tanacetum cinerariifolium]
MNIMPCGSKYKTTQELWVAILKTFDGNEATKKMKKNLLKQRRNQSQIPRTWLLSLQQNTVRELKKLTLLVFPLLALMFPLLVLILEWPVSAKTLLVHEATKKTKKNQLKQRYGNFKDEGSETLEQTFN